VTGGILTSAAPMGITRRPKPASGVPVAAFDEGEHGVNVRVSALGGCRPPRTRGPHAHEFFTVLYFEDAGGWHEAGGERRRVRDRDVVAVPPGAVHDFGGADARAGVALRFMPGAVSAPPWASHLHARAPEEAQVRELIDGLADELRGQGIGFRRAVDARLSLILVLLSRLSHSSSEQDGGAASTDPVLANLFALIDARYHEPLTLATVAAEVARSPRHLSRTVRRVTGRTVTELIEQRRMEAARRLLVDTTHNVDVIARAVGFDDGGYFARRFRRVHALPPSAWRKRWR
jgi:AraC family transcriptional regulator, transcriptional activator of pobA